MFSCSPKVYLALGCFLLLTASAALADTVTVANGDQLHGEIDKVEGGKLHLKTDYAGTIQIDWSQVTQIDSDANYSVQAETGIRYLGEIAVSGDKVVITEEADKRSEIAASDVVSGVRLVDSEPPGFWQLLNASLGLGYSFTRGNSNQTQSSVSADADYSQEKYKIQGDLTSIFSRLEDAEQTSRHALSSRYDRFLSARAFSFGLAGFERNDRQKLDLRSRFGGGFGWKLQRSKVNELDLLGGFTYTNEQFRSEDGQPAPRSSTGEGLFGFEWASSQIRGVRLSTRLTAHPNLVQTGRYRIEYDTSARVPLISGLNMTVSLFDRYDSRPPRLDVKHNDYGLVSTFGYTF